MGSIVHSVVQEVFESEQTHLRGSGLCWYLVRTTVSFWSTTTLVPPLTAHCHHKHTLDSRDQPNKRNHDIFPSSLGNNEPKMSGVCLHAWFGWLLCLCQDTWWVPVAASEKGHWKVCCRHSLHFHGQTTTGQKKHQLLFPVCVYVQAYRIIHSIVIDARKQAFEGRKGLPKTSCK